MDIHTKPQGQHVFGPPMLREHIESGDVRYGEDVLLELGGDRFIGTLRTTGVDVYVSNECRDYMVYSDMFPRKIAWNFSALYYLKDGAPA